MIEEGTSSAMSEAFITPDVLRWARIRSQLDIETVAKKIPVKGEKLFEWETGATKPTFIQAQRLAKILHIPFGYLYLKQPPAEVQTIPDLRTMNDYKIKNYSADLHDVISDVTRKQDWYRDYLKENDALPLTFIGRYNYSSPVDDIARDISETLRLTLNDRITSRNWEEYFKLLVERIESVGVLVMRSGIVGTNTHRILNVNEFRGFTICDTLAPVIFINGADAKAAQIFTLVHELVHLWLGASGVTNNGVITEVSIIQNNVEKKCNEVAAEILVPKEQILLQWNRNLTINENAESLCRFFKVSSIVVARRARDLGLISIDEFYEYYLNQVEKWKQQKDDRESGGSFYRNLPIANSQRFTFTVLQCVYSQEILLRYGAQLLGIKPGTLDHFAQEVGLL